LERYHASSVEIAGRAVLIFGASGAGKSALALELMAWGARLVSDDQCEITVEGGRVFVRAPVAIRGQIEARGVGILNADAAEVAEVVLVVDLDQGETERLPPQRQRDVAGVLLPLQHKVEKAHFPAAILQYLRSGRRA